MIFRIRKILIEASRENEIMEKMGLHCLVLTFSCVMVKTNALKECDFATPYGAHLDWWLWYQMFYASEVVYLDKKLTYWRMHGGSYIQRVDRVCNFRIKIMQFMCKKFNDAVLGFLFALILCVGVLTLDVARMADGDDAVVLLDKILKKNIVGCLNDLGAAIV